MDDIEQRLRKAYDFLRNEGHFVTANTIAAALTEIVRLRGEKNAGSNVGSPMGWKLVPIEPTNTMVEGASSMLPTSLTLTQCYELFREVWAVALSLVPQPPQDVG
jgi:hypothetical protein